MGIRNQSDGKNGSVFSEDVLKIEKCGPNEDYLIVIDVPGIFRSPSEGLTTKSDVEMVRKLVTGYIKNERTIILAVLPSNVDIATQEILTMAKDYDPSGERTLAVLTKPDTLTEKSSKSAVCDLILGKKNPLTLGYYVVRNRGADDDGTQALDEAEFFDQAPWNTLPAKRVGAEALKTRLGELLNHIAKREFPKLRKDISEKLEAAKKRLNNLGLSRHSEREQRSYLGGIASKFQDIVNAALHAQYQRHALFERKPELLLITLILAESDHFSHAFEDYGGVWQFEDVPNVSDQEGTKLAATDDEARKPLRSENFPELEGIICNEDAIAAPKAGIMAWIKEVHSGSRGAEMGTFGGGILSRTFKSQSAHWSPITRSYMSQAIMLIHRFITTTLAELCTDTLLEEQLWGAILDDILSRYRAAMETAEFLVSLERNTQAYTLNHYFNDNLQKVRSERVANRLLGKAYTATQTTTTFGARPEHITSILNPLVVRMDDVRAVTINKGNDE
jgi:conserved oligomeric Golgi complex subunit 4